MAVPQVVLAAILSIIGIGGGIGPNSTLANISCTEAVDLVFIISGQKFSVDIIGQDISP